MLDDQLKTQLSAYLERVQQPFELVASLNDSDTSREMLELLQTIQSLRSDKITLRTDGNDARKPSFTLQRVGSTSQLLKAVVDGTAAAYIVATDNGILHRMRQLAPGKTLIEAPTAGASATCKSCAHCPWMAMNALQGVVACLENIDSGRGEVLVPEAVRRKALGCIDRMLDFVRQHPASVAQPATRASGLVPNIGAA